MKKPRYIYLFLPLIIWLLNQAFLLRPSFFYSAMALGLLLIIFGVRALARLDKNKYWPLLIAPPALFFLSFSLYVTLIPNRWPSNFWIQGIFILEAWFIFSYLRNLYYYLAYHALERQQKLSDLLVSGGFLSMFAIGASFYGLPAFINWPLYLLLLSLAPLIFLLFSQFIPFKNLNLKTNLILLLTNTLMLLELAGVISLLPLNYNLLGFVLALAYSFQLLVLQLSWRGELTAKRLKLPIIALVALVIILFLTASWL